MKMGLQDITVTDVFLRETMVEIDGSGFTPYSVVYVNGRRRDDTVYVSPERLFLPNEARPLSALDEIEVCQTSPNRVILSTAEAP